MKMLFIFYPLELMLCCTLNNFWKETEKEEERPGSGVDYFMTSQRAFFHTLRALFLFLNDVANNRRADILGRLT